MTSSRFPARARRPTSTRTSRPPEVRLDDEMLERIGAVAPAGAAAGVPLI
jgi:hypothetical protein